MLNVKRLLTTLRRAAAAFRATPGRRGRLVVLPTGAEVFVLGDLHGNLENLRVLLHHADLAGNLNRHLVLQEVVHGTFRYPLGGDKSHQLLDLTAALKCQYPDRVHFLLGNHELAQWTQRRIAKNEEDLVELFKAGVDLHYGEDSGAVYALYRDLFAAAPLALRTANRVFLSHSLPNADRLETFDPAVLEREVHDDTELASGGAVHALLWGRDTSADNAAEFLAKVDADLLITGHIPCENGFDTPNDRQLILDSLGAPAAYCLFPTDRPLTLTELVAGVRVL